MKIHIIPQPNKISVGDKKVFEFHSLCNLNVQKGCDKALSDLTEFVSEEFEFELLGTGKETIRLSVDESFNKAESYTLHITSKKENKVLLRIQHIWLYSLGINKVC